MGHPRSLYMLQLIRHLALLWMTCIPIILTAQTPVQELEEIHKEIDFHSRQSPLDSVKAIFTWVTGNISYDTERKFQLSTSRDTFTDLAQKVARERKAVCLGYAALFKELCNMNSIPAFVVKGRVIIPDEAEVDNHAWVVFKADQHWHLADPTWGAGYVAGHRFTYHQNWDFFDPVPNKFINTHYPFDPAFQLLDTPLTYEAFVKNKQLTVSVTDTLNYRSVLKDKMVQEDRIKTLKRALLFKPNDPFLMHDLATYLQEDASAMVKDCIYEYNMKGDISDDSECISHVSRAEDLLKQAIRIYEKLLKMDAPQKDTAWMNLAASKNNLKTVQILKQNAY